MNCTRCDGTGFLNIHQVPEDIARLGPESILLWVNGTEDHDVKVCDCCGNGEDWYGEPGTHTTEPTSSGWDTPGIPECI